MNKMRFKLDNLTNKSATKTLFILSDLNWKQEIYVTALFPTGRIPFICIKTLWKVYKIECPNTYTHRQFSIHSHVGLTLCFQNED